MFQRSGRYSGLEQILQTSFLTLLLIAAITSGLRAQPQDLKIDSADALLNLGNAPELMPRFAFTIEAWVRYNSTILWGTTQPTIYCANNNGPMPLSFGVHPLSRLLILNLKSNTANLNVASTSPITDFGWTHVAATWDGSTVKLYVDGNPSGSTPFSGLLLDGFFECYLGGLYNSSSHTWRGRIDEFRVWNYARSYSEINEAMNQQLDLNAGLVGSWHFNGQFGDETGGHQGLPFGSCSLLASTSPVDALQLVAPGRAQVNTTLDFKLRGTAPGSPYFLDNTFNGTSVGTPLIAPLSGNFPLNSPLLNLTYGPVAPGIFINYMGFTNSAGEATASFHVPNFPYLIGLQMQSAFLYLTSLNPMVLGEISQVISSDFKEPAPVVSSIYPSSGPLSQTWPITITGQNFQTTPQVLVDGIAATNVVLQSTSIVSCDFPTGLSLGSKSVVVVFPAEDPIYLGPAYSYVKDLIINSMNPTFANPGDSVVLTATGVEAGFTVEVAGIPAPITSAVLSSNNSSTIVFTMPSGAPCHAAVVLRNADGRNDTAVINPGPFIVTTIGAQGPISGGTTFYIVGGNFDSGVQVTVAGMAATLVSNSSSTLAAISPAGALGSAAVVVTNVDGCTVATTFLYQ